MKKILIAFFVFFVQPQALLADPLQLFEHEWVGSWKDNDNSELTERIRLDLDGFNTGLIVTDSDKNKTVYSLAVESKEINDAGQLVVVSVNGRRVDTFRLENEDGQPLVDNDGKSLVLDGSIKPVLRGTYSFDKGARTGTTLLRPVNAREVITSLVGQEQDPVKQSTFKQDR